MPAPRGGASGSAPLRSSALGRPPERTDSFRYADGPPPRGAPRPLHQHNSRVTPQRARDPGPLVLKAFCLLSRAPPSEAGAGENGYHRRWRARRAAAPTDAPMMLTGPPDCAWCPAPCSPLRGRPPRGALGRRAARPRGWSDQTAAGSRSTLRTFQACNAPQQMCKAEQRERAVTVADGRPIPCGSHPARSRCLTAAACGAYLDHEAIGLGCFSGAATPLTRMRRRLRFVATRL